jgi:hypothetical protein
VSSFNDKKSGEQQFTGLVSSDDYYSLLLNKTKTKKDSVFKTEYTIALRAAAVRLFSDSVLNAFATLELTLMSGNRLTIDSVKCSNNPIKMGKSVGFQASISEYELKTLEGDPIVKFLVTGIMFTTFTGKKLKQQREIATCLLRH